MRYVVGILALLLPLEAMAVDYTFIGNGSGSNGRWTPSNNWSPSGPPGANDTAILATQADEVQLNNVAATVGALVINRNNDFELSFDGIGQITINTALTAAAPNSTARNYLISAPVVLGGSNIWNVNSALAATTLTVSGPITGAHNLIKSGSGTLLLSNAGNSYGGTTTISGGTFALASTGTITSSVTVGTGASFNITALAGGFTVASGRSLGGTGNVHGKTVIQGTIAPGNSIGVLAVGNQDWVTGGQYTWEVNAVTGTAGTNWDLLNVAGTLDVVAGAGGFTIKLVSLDGTGANPGTTITGFSPAAQHTWTIATATSLTNFDPSKFALDASEFSGDQDGVWSIQQSGNNVLLVYSTPEPSTGAMILASSLLLFRRSRRSNPSIL